METEIWEDIVGYEGLYQVSNLGNIKRLYNARGVEKMLKSKKSGNGYLQYGLSKKGIVKSLFAHRLVALHLIPNPENKPQVNHKNGIRNDNRLENLEWCTASENHLHKFRVLGSINPYKGKFGKYHNRSKKVNQYDLQGNFIQTWGGIREAGRGLNISCGNISNCCKGKAKTAGGFKWEY